jgi:hypothetical protein
MTEAEWMATQDSNKSIDRLSVCMSQRKERLLSCAICRHAWDDIKYKRSRDAVEIAERFADGLVSDKELNRAHSLAWTAYQKESSARLYGQRLGNHMIRTKSEDILYMVVVATNVTQPYRLERFRHQFQTIDAFIGSVSFLRDIFGNPFRPVALDPAWLTSTVVTLANSIYTDRAFDRMPILADALEEAGCDNVDVLLHCRGDGPHVKGCWVVDLVLGKA